MKSILSHAKLRRNTALALALALCISLAPFAFADDGPPTGPSQPQTAVADQPQLPATTSDAAQAAVTTPDAMNIIPASARILTVDIGDDGTRMHIGDAIYDALEAQEASWYDFDEVHVTGNPDLVDLSGFLSQYTDSGKAGPSLDLSNVEEVWKLVRTNLAGDSYVPSIVLPDTVTAIGERAFYGCKALTQISLPDGLKTISESAFQKCEALSGLTIPGGVTAIGEHAFDGCKALTQINLPDGLKTISESAFDGCKALANIVIPDSVTSFGDFVFNNCSGLESVALPSGITSTGKNTFHNCEKLANVTLPANLTTIDRAAFQRCTALTTITIPDSVTTIGLFAFESCTALTGVTIPGGVSVVGKSAFLNCSALTKAVMMNGVTTLEPNAFGNCSSLTQLTLPNSMTTIGKNAFWGCTSLAAVTIPDNVSALKENTFYSCENLSDVTLAPKTSKMISIGESAFESCTSLTTITIPDSVASIGKLAFAKCGKLKEVTLDHENSGMTSIGERAFAGCHSLQNIILPERLDTLGTDLFLPDPYENPNVPAMHLQNVYFTGTKPQHWQASFEQVFNTQANPDLLLYYPAEDADSYTPLLGPWNPNDKNSKSLPYSPIELPPAVLSGLKPSKDGAPPAYEVWETPEFQVNVSNSPDSAKAMASQYRVARPSKWELHAQTADGPVVASGTWAPESARFHAAIYPAASRPVGVCQLIVDSNVQIRVPGNHLWRDFPRELGGSADTKVPIEFLPPHPPAEASWLLTVQNGTGGGYYEAEHSAPIVAELTAAPPTSGAKFRRWELVSGTGTFADANSPSTRFTMAVGDSTIRAVFDTGTIAPSPLPTPAPTPSPATDDRANGLSAAALLLLAAGMAVAARRKRGDR